MQTLSAYIAVLHEAVPSVHCTGLLTSMQRTEAISRNNTMRSRMILRAQFILYVDDQQRSADFYRQVLLRDPTLDVPGMTEFLLGEATILGIMPASGIRLLLGDALPDPSVAAGIPRAEVYLVVAEAAQYIARAVQAGALLLSPFEVRDWGHTAAYVLDPDGHVLAIAELLPDAKA